MDGNLEALNEYQRQVDKDAEEELALEAAREDLAEELFEAYFNNNEEVISEIDQSLYEEDALYFLELLRNNFTDSGAALRTTYKKYIALLCYEYVGNAQMKTIVRIRETML